VENSKRNEEYEGDAIFVSYGKKDLLLHNTEGGEEEINREIEKRGGGDLKTKTHKLIIRNKRRQGVESTEREPAGGE